MPDPSRRGKKNRVLKATTLGRLLGIKTSTAVGKKNVTASTIFMKRLREYETIIIFKKVQFSPNSSHMTTMV